MNDNNNNNNNNNNWINSFLEIWMFCISLLIIGISLFFIIIDIKKHYKKEIGITQIYKIYLTILLSHNGNKI